MNTFALKGNICFSQNHNTLLTFSNSYVICENGICAGVYSYIPEKYAGIAVYDYGDNLIIPGLVDLHTHAPQYAFRGLGMDLELIDWLNTHTFKEEQKYSNLEYARKAYSIFVEDLRKSGTTRVCVFGTIHNDATLLLMDMLEDAGICAFVGKVNMDRNSPEYLCEKNAEVSAAATEEWLAQCDKFTRVKPYELMHRNQVFIAHCPQSNTNLSSGATPIRAYLEKGIPVGLGSDIAAGHSLSIFHTMADAIQCSKLRWRMFDDSLAPLKVEEAFYMATKGGGQFFGKVGSFEEGYEFDAVIIDDTTLPHPQKLSLKHRLERFIYIGDDRQIRSVFIKGRQIL